MVRVTKSNQPKKYNQHVLGSKKKKNYVNLQKFWTFPKFLKVNVYGNQNYIYFFR